MDRPLHIRDVHNVSLENNNNDYPHLVALFSCKRKAVSNMVLVEGDIEVKCAAVQLRHVHNVSLKGISLTVLTPNMSGMAVQYAQNIHIQLNIACSLMSPHSQNDNCIGFLAYKANNIEMHSSHASNCSSGFVLLNTNNIHIINTTAMYNNGSSETTLSPGGIGLFLSSTINATIINATVTHNGYYGMYLLNATKGSIIDTTVGHNGDNGIYCMYANGIGIVNTTVMENTYDGIDLINSTETFIINTTLMYNGYDGIFMFWTTGISIFNTAVMHNSGNGIHQLNTIEINITSTTIAHNVYNGINPMNSSIIRIMNTTVMYNGNCGIYLEDTTRMTIAKAALMYNNYDGICLLNTSRCFIVNTTVMQNGYNGVGVLNSTAINIINTTVMYNGYDGIDLLNRNLSGVNTSALDVVYSGMYLKNNTEINIINVTVMYNGADGMELVNNTETSVIKSTVMYNRYHGMYLANNTKTSIVIVTAAYNGGDGMYMEYTTEIRVSNATLMYNGYDGIFMFWTIGISIFNTAVMHNSGNGIHQLNTIEINITSTTIAHNVYNGINLMNSSIIGIMNTTVMYNGNCGIYLEDTTSMTIAKATLMYNNYDGICLLNTSRCFIVNTTVMQNGYNGVGVLNSTAISIINTTVMYNGYDGIDLLNKNLSGINTSALDLVYDGMYLLNNTEINIINVTVMYNGADGMELVNNTKTSVIKSTVMYNSYHGMYLANNTKISIVIVTAAYNGGNGMYMVNTTEIRVSNATVMYNRYNGMKLVNTTRSSINKTTVMQNGFDGLYLVNTTSIRITSTTVSHNSFNGMGLLDSTSIIIINMTVLYNGYGGVISLNKTIIIINQVVNHNYFDGLYLKNTYTSRIGDNTTVTDNIAYDGIYVANTTNVSIINTNVTSNGNHGIGLINTVRISILTTTVMYNMYAGVLSHQTTDTSIINLAVISNGNEGIILHYANNAHIANVLLMHNGWKREVTTRDGNVLSTADPTSLPAVIVLYSSSLRVGGCNITNNSVSAVNAYASNITAYGDTVISNNRAIAGSAFILVQNSILKLTENSHLCFRSNHATDTGGVFYISDNVHHEYPAFSSLAYPLLASTCFLNTEGKRSKKQLFFANNTAGYGGDILYGGHVSYGLDGDWNCLLSFKNISNISQNGLSLVSSDPSRVCLCNGTGQPDCQIVADPAPHSIYPGESINISAVVVGQEFGTVAGSVYAQFLQSSATNGSPQLAKGQKIQDVTQENCNHLNYTIFSPSDTLEAVLILTIDNRRVSEFVTFKDHTDQTLEDFYRIHNISVLSLLKYSLYVNISFLPCPPGFMITTKQPFKCDCNQLLQKLQGVKCYIQDQTVGRSGLVWIGTSKEDNGTVVASEYCSFDYCHKGDSNVTLSDPDSQCNYNHSGTLCGGCQPGLSVALGSAQCLPCSNRYLALLIPFALAGPALVFFIKLLDLTISQGTINGLIFYANIVKANEYIFLPQRQTNPLTLFIAWLNLDLGVETCFFNGLTVYTKTWLQFVFPIYIWSIAGLIIILAKYSDRVAKVMGKNSVPVLAMLFLLSYAKLFRTIISSLSYTMLYSSHNHKAVWSADGNVDYLGPKHAPLFAVAVAALLFLWLPYTLLLFLGQWLHKCHCRLIDHCLTKIKPFLDAHHGPVKGKHHYWFGALLLVRAAILLLTALIPANHSVIVNFCVSVSAILLIYFGLIVYQNISVAMFDASFFVNLALLGVCNVFTTTVRKDQSVAAYPLIGIAFIQFLGLLLFKVFSILKRNERVMACLRKRRSAEDDWELYEQAALQRERESDTEDEDSELCGSIESLPTY